MFFIQTLNFIAFKVNKFNHLLKVADFYLFGFSFFLSLSLCCVCYRKDSFYSVNVVASASWTPSSCSKTSHWNNFHWLEQDITKYILTLNVHLLLVVFMKAILFYLLLWQTFLNICIKLSSIDFFHSRHKGLYYPLPLKANGFGMVLTLANIFELRC